MVFSLEGKTAVVSGGSRGIGKAIARAYVDEGVNVALVGRNPENVRAASCELSLRISSPQRVAGFVCDVSDVAQISHLWNEIAVWSDGIIDVLVNCAGVLDAEPFSCLTEREWDRVLDTNLKGSFFMLQHAIPLLEKSAAARVINISSNAGRMGGYENGLAYSASKGGIISLTYGAARRLAPHGITVNCIAPGTIESDMSNEYDEEAHRRLLARFPVGRLGKPEEVAAAACYFASDESAFTTGAVLDVNGGLFMG